MCVRILNKDTNEETDSTVEFADMLGVGTNELPVENMYNQLIPESCLCQVDIKKACQMFGFNYSENEDFEAIISKKTKTEVIKDILNYK